MVYTLGIVYYEVIDMIVQEKIKALRRQTGLSQAKFAMLLEIPVANISKWEQGVTTPPEYVLRLIEKELKRQGLVR